MKFFGWFGEFLGSIRSLPSGGLDIFNRWGEKIGRIEPASGGWFGDLLIGIFMTPIFWLIELALFVVILFFVLPYLLWTFPSMHPVLCTFVLVVMIGLYLMRKRSLAARAKMNQTDRIREFERYGYRLSILKKVLIGAVLLGLFIIGEKVKRGTMPNITPDDINNFFVPQSDSRPDQESKKSKSKSANQRVKKVKPGVNEMQARPAEPNTPQAQRPPEQTNNTVQSYQFPGGGYFTLSWYGERRSTVVRIFTAFGNRKVVPVGKLTEAQAREVFEGLSILGYVGPFDEVQGRLFAQDALKISSNVRTQ